MRRKLLAPALFLAVLGGCRPGKPPTYEEEGILMADWELYRRLREDGRFGAVIPFLEANYRVRPDSLSSLGVGDLHALSWDEALSRRRRRMLEGAP